MAADVALSQALAYARDLRNLYEVTRAREQEWSGRATSCAPHTSSR
jgi:hypothetical protein